MEKLFGLDMILIAGALGSALALSLAGLALLAWRGRVMFKLGLRPIARRPAQSSLIVFGLMLATLIITTAFVTGDTFSHTLRSLAVEDLGEIDEEIRQLNQVGPFGAEQRYFKLDRYEGLARALDGYDRVDRVVPAINEFISVVDVTSRQSESWVEILGLHSIDLGLLHPGGLTSTRGALVQLEALGPNEVYLNAVAARSLGAAPGDELKVYAAAEPTTLFVRAVVGAGNNPRLILPLRRAQALFDQRGNINVIFVSNLGDALAGADRSAEVTTHLRGLLANRQVAAGLFNLLARDGAVVAALRQEAAQRSGNLQADLLALAAGLESGVLDAEMTSLLTDQDLGWWILRLLDEAQWRSPAARDRLRWLMAQASEMTVYNNKRNRLEESEAIGNAATALIVATGLFGIASGLLLIFLIFVLLAAERKPEMGMTRAIGGQRRHLVEMFVYEGTAYDLAAASVGVALGVLAGILIAGVIQQALAAEVDLAIRPNVTARSLGVSYSLGMLVTFGTVLFSAYKVSRLNIVAAIRDLPEPAPSPSERRRRLLAPFRALVEGFHYLRASGPFRRRVWRALGAWLVGVPAGVLGLVWAGFRSGPLTLLGGLLLFVISQPEANLTGCGLGASFGLIGAGLTLRGLLAWALHGQPGPAARLSFTLTGLGLAVLWSVPLDALEWLGVKDVVAGPEFFFLSGVFLVAGAVLVLMHNADLLLWTILRLLGGARHLAPALRLGIAYPLTNRFRTGLTLAMFAVVVFSVVFIAAVFKTAEAAYTDLETLTGGYHLRLTTSYLNPVTDLRKAIAASPSVREADFAVVASQSRASVELRQAGGQWRNQIITGANAEFLGRARNTLIVRAEGYESDAEVWRTLRDRPGYALIDRYSVPSRQSGARIGGDVFELQGVYVEDESMRPTVVEVRDPGSGATFHLTIIGVFQPAASLYGGLLTSQATLDDGFPSPPSPTTHYLRLADGVDPAAAGRALESAFLRYSLQSTDLLAEVRLEQRSQGVIAALLQGFLTVGLVVGVAALGVISTRAVVERRQQIGMLRALGFQREMVGWSFLIESSFVALLGISLGAGLALIPAYHLITETAQGEPNLRFQVPWESIGVVVAVAYGMTLLTTWLPAWQAAQVPPAEALRYE